MRQNVALKHLVTSKRNKSHRPSPRIACGKQSSPLFTVFHVFSITWHGLNWTLVCFSPSCDLFGQIKTQQSNSSANPKKNLPRPFWWCGLCLVPNELWSSSFVMGTWSCSQERFAYWDVDEQNQQLVEASREWINIQSGLTTKYVAFLFGLSSCVCVLALAPLLVMYLPRGKCNRFTNSSTDQSGWDQSKLTIGLFILKILTPYNTQSYLC